MAKRFLILGFLIAAACGGAPSENTDVAPTRESIGTAYAAVPELNLRKEPNDASEVVAMMQEGEPLTLLADKGDWIEVRIDFERTGWAKKAETSEEQPGGQTAGEGGVRFRKPPNPVPSPTPATGEIVLIANVNEYGRVMSIRTETNTTGSSILEAKNTNELQNAEFYPLRRGGKAIPFEYEYRVSY